MLAVLLQDRDFVCVCVCVSTCVHVDVGLSWHLQSQQGRAATDVHSLLQFITIVNRCLSTCVCGNVSKRHTASPDIYNLFCEHVCVGASACSLCTY